MFEVPQALSGVSPLFPPLQAVPSLSRPVSDEQTTSPRLQGPSVGTLIQHGWTRPTGLTARGLLLLWAQHRRTAHQAHCGMHTSKGRLSSPGGLPEQRALPCVCAIQGLKPQGLPPGMQGNRSCHPHISGTRSPYHPGQRPPRAGRARLCCPHCPPSDTAGRSCALRGRPWGWTSGLYPQY